MTRGNAILSISPQLILSLLELDNVEFVAGTWDFALDCLKLKIATPDLPELPGDAAAPDVVVEKTVRLV